MWEFLFYHWGKMTSGRILKDILFRTLADNPSRGKVDGFKYMCILHLLRGYTQCCGRKGDSPRLFLAMPGLWGVPVIQCSGLVVIGDHQDHTHGLVTTAEVVGS